MMKDFEKNKNLIIDEFYNEEFDKIQDSIKSSIEYMTFKEKLKRSDEQLKLLDSDDLDFEINIGSLIEQAFEIKSVRKSRIEFILFLTVSILILSLYGLLVFTNGVRAFILSQFAFITILPWSLIPITILRVKRGEL